jgi:hypothetical protein
MPGQKFKHPLLQILQEGSQSNGRMTTNRAIDDTTAMQAVSMEECTDNSIEGDSILSCV